jgi:tRNA1Val (adenine37-N6)-methyltransferase
MVLVEAVKGGGVFLRTEPPVIVYREPGKYTDEIYEIYGY